MFLTRIIKRHNALLRPLVQIFREAENNFQERPLGIFFRSKSLIDFHCALNHIYSQAPLAPEIIYELPKLLQQVNLIPNNDTYLRLFSIKRLPRLEETEASVMKQCYTQAIKDHCDNLAENDIYMIYQNLSTLVEQNEKSDIFNRFEDDNTSAIFKKVLDTFSDKLPVFQTNIKYNIMLLSKSLKVYNPQFSNYVKFNFLNNYRELSMLECLTTLSYLSDTRCFPHNFFYAVKEKWLDVIAPEPILLDKSEASLLKMMEILSKQRLHYCTKLTEKVINLVHRNINHFDGADLVRTLYYYSKDRLQFEDEQLVEEIVRHLDPKIHQLNSKQIKLLVIALGHLEFKQIEFIKRMGSNSHFLGALKENEKLKDQEYLTYLSQIVSG